MGGCCGAMKTGQKSLPDKKKSPSDATNQEKSNGKETVAAPQTVPATETNKAPADETKQEERREDNGEQKQELIASPVKVSVNATEPVTGVTENIMDLETAVAPFEGVISNDQPQLEVQGHVASADSEFLLPYQIPVQHSFSSSSTTTTTITTTTFKQEEFQLRVDEPRLEATLPEEEVQLSITENVLGSSAGEVEVPSISTSVEVETVTKKTEAVSESIPEVAELRAGGGVDLVLGSGVSEELSAEEPLLAVEKSISLEAQTPLAETLESKHDDPILDVAPETDVSLTAPDTAEFGSAGHPDPFICICPCPPQPPSPKRHAESQFMAVCPPGFSFVGSDNSEQVVDVEEKVEIQEGDSTTDWDTAGEPDPSICICPPEPPSPERPVGPHLISPCPPGPYYTADGSEKVVDVEEIVKTPEVDATTAVEPEPSIVVCPPRPPSPEPPVESHLIAVCPPGPSFTPDASEQVVEDLGQEVTSESVNSQTEVPLEETVPASVPEEIATPADLPIDKDLAADIDLQQQVVADLETALESASEVPPEPVPVADSETAASLEEPDQPQPPVADDQEVPTDAPVEPQLLPVLEPEIPAATEADSSAQHADDLPPPPPVTQEQVVEPQVEQVSAPEVETLPEVADLSDSPPVTIVVEKTEESQPPVDSADNVKVNDEVEVVADDASIQPEPSSTTTEPLPYQDSQAEESLPLQEPDQEQQSYQEQQVSIPDSLATEPTDQVPESVAAAIVETDPTISSVVLESVGEQAQQSRETWWKEGGQVEGETEVPVLELVSDQSQQSRKEWWDQSDSNPEKVESTAEEEPLPPVPVPQELPTDPSSPPPPPEDESSIPPPSEQEEEAAVVAPIPAEVIEAVSPSSDSFPEVIPDPLPSTFDQGDAIDATPVVPGEASPVAVESPLSVDGSSTVPTESSGDVLSQSSDEADTPASIVSPEGSTPGSNLSPEAVEPAAAPSTAATKEPISAEA